MVVCLTTGIRGLLHWIDQKFEKQAVCRLKSRTNLFGQWTLIVWMLLMCRIGEAINPGPRPDATDFVLGTFNPTGLNGKAPFIVSQLAHGDVWAITETHLSGSALQTFRSSMHFAEGPYRYCVGGHPVPDPKNRMFHTAWRGVAVLSKYPTRALPNHWPQGVQESSRAVVTATLIQDVWMTGATIYGEPESSFYPEAKTNNQVLLSHAVEQVCHLSTGPRYVAGDWNVAYGTLPVFDTLTEAGFCDLQDIAHSLWGCQVQPTCKSVTRKDYCFISRELQYLLKDVQVADGIFPDHAVLWGVFRGLSQTLPRHVWLNPKPFPWPNDWRVDEQFWNNSMGTSDARYRALWQHIETQAEQAVPFALGKSVKGRAHTEKPKPMRDGRVSPLKRAGSGAVQPHFVAASYRHSQWLRQARRLQAYVKFVQTHGHHNEHARNLWGSIIRAKGFFDSFSEWWVSSPWKTCGAPSVLPMHSPSAQIAAHVFDTVMLGFRSFEQELRRTSSLYARQRRAQNPNLIFQDIRSHPVKGVEVLLKTTTGCIAEVRQEDCSLVLEQPLQLDCDKPILCQGNPLQVIHHEGDCLWLHSVDQLQPGMTIAQSNHAGTTEELFALFLRVWKDMWGRHENVPVDRWKVILDFARDKLPRVDLSWPSLDAVSLERCIARKKKTTTAGLDGVTIEDLRSMCPAALANFAAIFAEAESTGASPTQMLAGRVTCLAKVDDPIDALDFRPITVLGLLFRCWGTHHAKQAIRKLDEHLPQGLFGSRPTRYAGQVWSHLLWSIELAYENALPLSGIIADIRKAFHYLPRQVVFEACAILGLPFPLLIAWAGALGHMPRRFQFHGSISAPAFSTCGLPEGCALSCLGMIVVDTLFHKWMLHHFPMCQPLSYVDDWQILVADPQRIHAVFAELERFVSELDLLLDSKKTHTWSIQAEGRAILRDQGFCSVHSSKNLGAHVQYTRQHTNKTLTARLATVAPLWAKLRLSASPYSLKVRAILVAAWPRAMHGIAAVTVSLQAFQTLRAGALRGIREDGIGSNAHVQLGLVEQPSLDPQFWAIVQTFRLTRDCGHAERVEPLLATLAAGRVSLPSNTITQTLLHRIQILGWHVSSGGMLCDLFGIFSLFEVSITELLLRMEYQWTFVVSQSVSHRPCFAGLDRCDPRATRAWLSTLEVSDRALFRKVLNGTHITQDGKKYCQEASDDICPYCECSDSRYHRFWECDRFHEFRKHLSPEERAVICDLPPAVTGCGWSLAPTTMVEWNAHFVSLPDVLLPRLREPASETIHLFTDGSCVDQHAPELRFAAWALIRAANCGSQIQHATVVAAQPLRGLLQSAIRAEIFAVLQALRHTAEHGGVVMIWTDSDAVVRKFRRISAGHLVRMNSSHSDLWLEISQLLHDARAPRLITHVFAHRCIDLAENFLQEWCFLHNHLADQNAVHANYARDKPFRLLRGRHQAALRFTSHYNSLVQRVQLAISQAVVRMEKPVQLDADCDMGHDVEVPTWSPLPELSLPQQAVKWYGDAVVRSILSWFWQGLAEGGETIWISHFQLYALHACYWQERASPHLAWTEVARWL